jgi:hypothetical protein
MGKLLPGPGALQLRQQAGQLSSGSALRMAVLPAGLIFCRAIPDAGFCRPGF